MRGQGIWADLVNQRFKRTAGRLGLMGRRIPLDTSLFRPPARPSREAGRGPARGGPDDRQLPLL
jgi:hypothetical protein